MPPRISALALRAWGGFFVVVALVASAALTIGRYLEGERARDLVFVTLAGALVLVLAIGLMLLRALRVRISA